MMRLDDEPFRWMDGWIDYLYILLAGIKKFYLIYLSIYLSKNFSKYCMQTFFVLYRCLYLGKKEIFRLCHLINHISFFWETRVYYNTHTLGKFLKTSMRVMSVCLFFDNIDNSVDMSTNLCFIF